MKKDHMAGGCQGAVAAVAVRCGGHRIAGVDLSRRSFVELAVDARLRSRRAVRGDHSEPQVGRMDAEERDRRYSRRLGTG